MTRSNGTWADTTENSAYLSTEFGQNLAIKKLGFQSVDELENVVGRYKKGKRVGQLKGLLKWSKVTAGGWVTEFKCVVPPNVTYAYHIVDSWTGDVIYPKGLKLQEIQDWKKADLYNTLVAMGKAKKAKQLEEVATVVNVPSNEEIEIINWDEYHLKLINDNLDWNLEPRLKGESDLDFANRINDYVIDKYAEKNNISEDLSIKYKRILKDATAKNQARIDCKIAQENASKNKALWERMKNKHGDNFNIEPKGIDESEEQFEDRIYNWLWDYTAPVKA